MRRVLLLAAAASSARTSCPGAPFVEDASRQQLCQRFPPFGLRHALRCNQPFDALDLRSLDLRPRDPPPAPCVAYASCAVVGSSGRLIGAGHGPLIDGHEAVFRANAAPHGREVKLAASGVVRSPRPGYATWACARPGRL